MYIASENQLLGEKYGWLTSLVYPEIYVFEGVQQASITIEETVTNLTATVSGPISLSITYTPYGDNSTFIEDPDDSPYLYDYYGDIFWSYSIGRAHNANGSFNAHQLGPTNFIGVSFDIIDCEWYDLGKLLPVSGIWISVDKFGLLAPYISLASIVILAIFAAVVFFKYGKKR